MSQIPTTIRHITLMHDPLYRLGIAWQNVGYNQPPHTQLPFPKH
jgi:rhamnogalacturonan endolyase